MSEIVVANSFMEPVASVDQALARYQKVKEFVSKILKEDVDFGTIPGTGSKPALLKPGAEKLSTFFGLHPIFEILEKTEDWTGDQHGGEAFFYYMYRCNLLRNGEIVGSGDGSCNSWEKKYRYRMTERICPDCGHTPVIKGKQEYGGGWLCWAKKGGCGNKWLIGDPVIADQKVDVVKNPDPADQVNTYLKISQKRSMVAAVLVTVNASDYFTQDIEDYIPEGTYKDVTEEAAPKQAPVPKKKSDNSKRPWQPDKLREMLRKKADTYPKDYVVDEKARQQFAAALDQFTVGKRKPVQVELGLLESTKDSDQCYLQAVMDWLCASWNSDLQSYLVEKPVVLEELALVVAQFDSTVDSLPKDEKIIAELGMTEGY